MHRGSAEPLFLLRMLTLGAEIQFSRLFQRDLNADRLKPAADSGGGSERWREPWSDGRTSLRWPLFLGQRVTYRAKQTDSHSALVAPATAPLMTDPDYLRGTAARLLISHRGSFHTGQPAATKGRPHRSLIKEAEAGGFGSGSPAVEPDWSIYNSNGGLGGVLFISTTCRCRSDRTEPM